MQNDSLSAAPLVSSTVVRWCLAVSLVLAVSGVVHLGVFLADDRPWRGPVSWRKPATFGLSFGLTVATITWVASYVDLPRRLLDRLLVVFAVDSVVEVAGITLQAWRGVPSHLNRSTPFNTGVAMVLAVGGAVLVLVLGAIAVAVLRGRVLGPPSLRLALRAGFALLVVGLLSGAAMIAAGTVAMNTGPPARAYQVTGFLKEVHGVTLHGVLVLPGLAWLLGRRPMEESARVAVVRAAVAAYLVLVLAVLAIDLATI